MQDIEEFLIVTETTEVDEDKTHSSTNVLKCKGSFTNALGFFNRQCANVREESKNKFPFIKVTVSLVHGPSGDKIIVENLFNKD